MIGPPSGFNHTQDARVQGGNNPVVTSMNSAVIRFSLLISIDLPLPRRDLITIPLKPSRAPVVTEEGFGDSDNRDNRSHPRDNRCVKVVSQVRQNRDVLLFSRSGSAGVRLSTQLKTKNITVSTIMMCANARSSSISVLPYRRTLHASQRRKKR